MQIFIATFWKNPQFRITLSNPDDSDDEYTDDNNERQCVLLVSLMQKNRRIQRLKFLTVGLTVYHVSVSLTLLIYQL